MQINDFLKANITRLQLLSDIERHKDLTFNVLFHDKCMDGAISAAVVCKYLENNYGIDACLTPVRYGDASIKQFTASDYVIIVDFSYTPEQLQEIATKARRVLIIDHHYTATKAIMDWVETNLPEFSYYLDLDPKGKNECGGSLAHQLFGEGPSQVIRFGKQHDLWLHDGNLNDMALWFNYFVSDCFNNYSSQNVVSLIMDCMDDEKIISRYLKLGKAVLDEAVKEMGHLIQEEGRMYEIDFVFGPDLEIQKLVVPVVELPKQYASIAGGELARNYNVGVMFTHSDGKYTYSLRSKHSDFDVGYYAKHMGGGGHRLAAGFVSTKAPHELFKLVDDPNPIKFDPFKIE